MADDIIEIILDFVGEILEEFFGKIFRKRKRNKKSRRR